MLQEYFKNKLSEGLNTLPTADAFNQQMDAVKPKLTFSNFMHDPNYSGNRKNLAKGLLTGLATAIPAIAGGYPGAGAVGLLSGTAGGYMKANQNDKQNQFYGNLAGQYFPDVELPKGMDWTDDLLKNISTLENARNNNDYKQLSYGLQQDRYELLKDKYDRELGLKEAKQNDPTMGGKLVQRRTLMPDLQVNNPELYSKINQAYDFTGGRNQGYLDEYIPRSAYNDMLLGKTQLGQAKINTEIGKLGVQDSQINKNNRGPAPKVPKAPTVDRPYTVKIKDRLGNNISVKMSKEEYAEHQGIKPKPTPTNNTVKVKSPDGKIGSIPANKLQDAIKRGFVKI